MKTLAIIPARGGSKRIPKKNIKKFLGFPIIKYSIDAAIKSNCFSEVMVSTDDLKITKIAKSYGACVPFLRSQNNASDKATLVDVLLEVLLKYQENNKKFNYVCCIFATAPFITPKKILEGYEIIKKTKTHGVIPVVQFSYPIQRAFKIEKHCLKMIWPENMLKNSQDMINTYHDCGQFYWFNVKNLLKEKKIFPRFSIPMEIPELEVQDIDTLDDWQIAELKYKMIVNNRKGNNAKRSNRTRDILGRWFRRQIRGQESWRRIRR